MRTSVIVAAVLLAAACAAAAAQAGLEAAPAAFVDPASFPALERPAPGAAGARPLRRVSFLWTPPEAFIAADAGAPPAGALQAFAAAGRPVPGGVVAGALQSFAAGALHVPRAYRLDARSLVAAALAADGAVLHYEVVRDPGLAVYESVGPDGRFTGREAAEAAVVELAVPAEAASIVLYRPVEAADGSVLLARVGGVSGW